eukprot:7141007-Alexandrium_andersonii.AAC.1
MHLHVFPVQKRSLRYPSASVALALACLSVASGLASSFPGTSYAKTTPRRAGPKLLRHAAG